MGIRTVVAPAALALLLGSCAADAAEEPGYEEEIPLGRTLEEVFSAGDDPNGVGFRDVRGTGTDSQGRVWVAEWDALIHLFDPSGRHIQTWDRGGDGPAEFRYIAGFDLDPSRDRVIVRDVQQIFVFDTEFRESARWVMPRAPGIVGSFPGIRFDPAGSGVLLPIVTVRDSVMQDTIRMVWHTGELHRFTEDGALVGAVGALVGGWMHLPPRTSARSRQPYAGDAVWTPLGSLGTLIGDGQKEYRLALLADGDTLRTLGRRLSAEEITGLEGPPFRRGFVYRAVFDESRQEVLACRTDPQGQGGRFEPATVDHFAVDGTYLGTLVWPSCPQRVDRSGIVYMVVYDELRVPILKGFRYATPT